MSRRACPNILARRILAISAVLATGLQAFAADAPNSNVTYDDSTWCSAYLASHPDSALSPDQHRRCVIAIATTYIEGEQNGIPPEQELLADDVSRHLLGTPRVNAPGGRARIIAQQPMSRVIAAIRNRRWSVDGNDAWILYDGYLTSDPTKPGFDVGERITVEKGLITEILVAAVAHPR